MTGSQMLLTACALATIPASAAPAKVEIRQDGEQFGLWRNGEPFYVKGAVYWAAPDNPAYPLTTVVERGGNAIRIGGEQLDELVSAAERLGLAVTIGLPLQSQRNGFDYDDQAAVAQQFEAMKAIVLRHRDSPATLIWGVGNELSHGNEVSKTYDNLKVWNAVNDIARMIHEVDPNHPTMTVIGMASLKRNDLKDIIERCPDLDLLGVNAYADIALVPGLVRQFGWTKPYLITEWGGDGSWQAKKTAWGAPLEPTTTEAATGFAARYRAPILEDRQRCLGSYAFFWQQAPWITPTWYSLYLRTGDRLEAVNVLQHLWTGAWPDNRAPAVTPLLIDGRSGADSIRLAPSTRHTAALEATDPEGDPLVYQWQILPEGAPDKAADLQSGTTAELTFVTPQDEGAYRLLVFVRDGRGNVASANIPFQVQP